MPITITNANFNTAIAAWLGGDTTTYGAITDWNTSAVTSMKEAFRSGVIYNGVTTNFNEDLSGWITSAVTDMTSMFEGASSFNKELKADVGGKWDVSSVTDMSGMFSGATAFNHSVRNWRVGRGTILTDMFNGAHSNMTNGTNGFAGGTDYIDASGNTPTYKYFSLKSNELSSARNDWFATPQVKDFGEMRDWNISAITSLHYKFNGQIFTDTGTGQSEDISNWDTGSVISFSGAFLGTGSLFNPDISNWDTSNATNVKYMFQGSGINCDLRSWNMDKVATNNFENMLNTSAQLPAPPTPTIAYFVLPLTDTNFNAAISEYYTPTNDTNALSYGSNILNSNITKYGSINTWDTSAITNMSNAFKNGYLGRNTTTFNEDITSWVTSSVTNMSHMFDGAANFNLAINPGSVAGAWDVSQVTDMSGMFSGASGFNQFIGDWVTDEVLNMNGMFKNTTSFNIELRTFVNKWNVDKVTNFTDMFLNSKMSDTLVNNGRLAPSSPTSSYFNSASVLPALTQQTFLTASSLWFSNNSSAINTYGNIGSWDTSKVVSMVDVFKDQTSFNSDISRWVTSAVTNMNSMFYGAHAFNQPISSGPNGQWVVSAVTDMSGMFSDAVAFNQSVRNWRVGRGTILTDMFNGAHNNMTNGTNGFAGGTDYIDANGNTPTYKYFSLKSNELSSAKNDWFATPQVKDFGEMRDWNISAITNLGYFFNGHKNFTVTELSSGQTEDISYWDTGSVTSFEAMFLNTDCTGAGNTFNINISNWDTSNASNVKYMFQGSGVNCDLRSWNVDKVDAANNKFENMLNTSAQTNSILNGGQAAPSTPTIAYFVLPLTDTNFNAAISEHFTPTNDTNALAYGSNILNSNITKYGSINVWDTSAITTMSNAFKNAYNGNNTVNFNEDISNWNTTSVINMSNMFDGCSTFNQNLSTNGNEWNTTAVTNMSSMFNDASGFNQNINTWDMAAVTSITGMFKGASTFNNATVSMENWLATPNASLNNFTELFSGAETFNVALTNWDTSKITNTSYMFKDCKVFNQNLTTDGSKWNTSKLINMAHMFNGASAFVGKTGTSVGIRNWTTNSVTNATSTFQDAVLLTTNIRYWVFPYTVVLTDMIKDANAFNAIADHNTHSYFQAIGANAGTPDWRFFDILGSICFLGSEKVQTDQGLIQFNNLSQCNTINGYKINKITKMLNADDHMIYIKAGAISNNIPNKGTFISRNHGIVINNHIVRAKTLVNGDSIIKAYRDPDMIYNVLTEIQTIMFVNNMPSETLNPNDPAVKRYM